MNDILNFIFDVLSRLFKLVFNDMLLDTNVSVGWVFVVIFSFGVMIKSLLNLPISMSSISVSPKIKFKKGNKDE